MFIDLKKERERETDDILFVCFFFFNFRNAGTAANAMYTEHIPHPQGLISSYIVLSGGFFLFFFLKPRAPFIFRTKACRADSAHNEMGSFSNPTSPPGEFRGGLGW